MQITDELRQMGGLQSISRELGISEAQAASGAEALAPAILGGFKKQAQAPAGLEGSVVCSLNSAAAACSTTSWRRNRRMSAAAMMCSGRSSAPRR